MPDGVCKFFTSRFNKLLPFVYDELRSMSEELGLQKYYECSDSRVYLYGHEEKSPKRTYSTQDINDFILTTSTMIYSNKPVDRVIWHLSDIINRDAPICHPDEDKKLTDPVAYALLYACSAIQSWTPSPHKSTLVMDCFYKLFLLLKEIQQNEGDGYGNILRNGATPESLADNVVTLMMELYEVLFSRLQATSEYSETKCVAVVWIACACSVDRWRHEFMRFYQIGLTLAKSIPNLEALARLEQKHANYLIMTGADDDEVDRFFALALQAVKKMPKMNEKLFWHIWNERLDHFLQSVATAICGNGKVDVHSVIRYLRDENIPDDPKRRKVDEKDPVMSVISNVFSAFMNRRFNASKLNEATYCFHKIFVAINTLQNDKSQKLLRNGATTDGVTDILIKLMIETYEAEFKKIDTRTSENAAAISYVAVWIAEACLNVRWKQEANRFYEIGVPLAQQTDCFENLARLYHSRAKYLIMTDAHEDEIDRLFELALQTINQMARKKEKLANYIASDRKQYHDQFILRIARSVCINMEIDITDLVEQLKTMRSDECLNDPRRFEVDSESIQQDPVIYAMSFARAALLHSQNMPSRPGDATNCFHKIFLAINAIQSEGSRYKDLLRNGVTLENVADVLVRLMIEIYRTNFHELDFSLPKSHS